MQLELALYRARNGKAPFKTWYDGLARDRRAFYAVTQRLSRLLAGSSVTARASVAKDRA